MAYECHRGLGRARGGPCQPASDEEEAFDEERKIEPGEEIHGLRAAPLPRVGLREPDLPPRLGQRVRSAASQRATRPTSTACCKSIARSPSALKKILDLSESLNEKAAGSDQTILELSQEAVSLLAWAIEKLGDPFAIAGFHSNTRHDVRYLHIKGYGEHWNDDVKARLAAMEAGWSTRMGAAMRHAAHYLGARQADKKLMLILTDGMPSDVDAHDERLLIEDARQAVKELDQQGIFPYCISLDPKADEYVADIFGRQYTVIDHVERLPERLPQLFMALTK